MAQYHGVWPAMSTPLTADGEIDVDGTHRVIDWLIEEGVQGLSALGSTGECAGLTRPQRKTLLETAVAASNGRVPVMGGANGTTVADVLSDLEMCAEVGVDAALVPPPFYYPVGAVSVTDFFTYVADRSPVGIFLYHIPRMTKVAIDPEAVEELAAHPNIVGLKDSNKDMVYFQKIAAIASEHDFSAFTGGDDLLYPSLCVGGHGIIGATVNVLPSVERGIYDAFQSGDHERALELQRQVIRKGVVASVGTFPAGFKGTLAARGLCGTSMTFPIPALNDAELEALREDMKAHGLL